MMRLIVETAKGEVDCLWTATVKWVNAENGGEHTIAFAQANTETAAIAQALRDAIRVIGHNP